MKNLNVALANNISVTSRSGSRKLVMAFGCATFVLGMAASASAAPQEVNLATPSQALTFCKSGAMATNNIDYISSSKGLVQFGPAYNCVQQKANMSNTKTVAGAAYVNSSSGAVTECKVASAMSAVKLCNNGGLGFYDIAYVLGGRHKTIGGQGYGCDLVIHKNSIGNAVCK